MTVKILLLKSGEDVIADLKEMVSPDEKVIGYFLTKPCVVKLIPKDSKDESKKETASSPDFNNKILTVICFLLSLYYSMKKGIVKIPKSISNSIYLEVIFTSMMLWNYLTKMN